MNTSLEALRTAYKDTTDTLFLVEVLPSYQSSHQELKQLPDQLEQLNEQIDYSKRQLSGLQADVEQGKIKPAEVDEFLDAEEAHIQEMLERADTLRQILEGALRRYYHIQPQVEERI
jgi:septal ring factor EnvC (AmiA/AmiB activator)